MIVFSILFILLIFLFIPFPLKINIYFSESTYLLKFLFFKVNLKDNKKINFFKKYLKQSFFNNLNLFFNLKFKPAASIKLNINFSCKDAMITSIFYGLLNSFYSCILFVFSIPFNIHKFLYNIHPDFSDEYMVKFQLSSIIFISIAQIIYIIFLLKNNKEENCFCRKEKNE